MNGKTMNFNTHRVIAVPSPDGFSYNVWTRLDYSPVDGYSVRSAFLYTSVDVLNDTSGSVADYASLLHQVLTTWRSASFTANRGLGDDTDRDRVAFSGYAPVTKRGRHHAVYFDLLKVVANMQPKRATKKITNP